LAVLGLALVAVNEQGSERHKINLPTSKRLLSPSLGRLPGAVNSFPATIALSPDRRYAALLNDGFGTQETQARQSIAVLDLQTNKLTEFPDDRLNDDAQQSYFLGLAFSTDGRRLYASMGSITDALGEKPGNTGNGIAVYGFRGGKVLPERFIKIGPQKLEPGKWVAKGLFKLPQGGAIPYPAGLAVVGSEKGDRLLVANNLSDNVVLLDAASGKTLETFDLSSNGLVPSSFPYTVVVSRDGRRAWCSLWNASQVAELDLVGGKVRRRIPLLAPGRATDPGSHPTALLLSRDEKLLYVSLSNADRVAAVPTAEGSHTRLLNTNLPGQAAGGSIPNALTLSPDGTRLFVADAGINAIAVFNVEGILTRPVLTQPIYDAEGFIPTDWYPSALAVEGEDLLVASAKGEGSGPNNGRDGVVGRRHREHPYIPTLMRASLARLNFSKAMTNLKELTREVEEDNLLHADPGKIDFVGGKNPIRHVIYIIKENRTYDQVLGDLKVGDGDPSLTMYGEDVTPNLHQLARQFGVLDNFYDSGEVSGDGHVWSTAAITTDYNEKTWQIGYRGKERTYDYGGTNADELPLEHGVADVDDPATGYLWGNLAAHHLTYRDYGEFINGEWCGKRQTTPGQERTEHREDKACPRPTVNKGESLPANVGDPHGGASPWPWGVPLVLRMVATKPELRDHYDPRFPDFNVRYPDQLRADEFLNEFEDFVKARSEGKGTQLPQFVLLYLPNDHTLGTTPGLPRPAASVADNDLAVGRVVEAVSHSPYWDDTAIFILEDDAQNGADHVDAHRSIAFVISKYSPGSMEHPFVAHQFYTTVNLIHTMETLLGLPPMNQNDAYAPLMGPMFSGAGQQAAFKADWRNRDNGFIYQANPKKGPGSEASKRFDFSRPDAVKASALNAILWLDRKGNVPMPASVHAVFPRSKVGD
jgi:DNA-binding beta-propeller fold protein YncE